MMQWPARWNSGAPASFLLSSILLVTSACCATLDPHGAKLSELELELSPVEEGWQPSTVTSVVQSHDGYLWLGTYNGLVRYDGVSSKVFDGDTNPGLANGRITSLFEDVAGTLWIGHETGELTRFQGGKFQTVPLGEHWPGGPLESITADEYRDLWVVNANGVLLRVRDGLRTEPMGGGSAIRKVMLSRTRTGQVWLVANGQVATLDRGKSETFRFKGTAETDFYQAVLPAHEGGVWAVINGGLRRFDEGRWEVERHGQSAYPGSQDPVTTLLETRSGLLLAGTLNDGLFVFGASGPPLHFNYTNGLSHNWVRSLCEDHEGNVWIGTGAGLDRLRPRKVRMLNPPDLWQGHNVQSFAARPDGSAWIGTEGAGLYRYQDKQWKVYTETNGLVNLFVWSVLATQRGDLFVGTWGGGLLMKNGERFEAEGELAKLSTAAVTALYEGTQGEIWIGTPGGLYCYEAGKLSCVADKERLLQPDVRAITQTPNGTLWFGMVGGGLGSRKDGRLRQFSKQDGLPSNYVQCLLAESDGSLWIGTADNGLARWRQGRFARIGAEQQLPDTSISHLVDDGVGNLWIGSHKGILRVSLEDLNRCADGETKSIHCQSYGKAEGLASLVCSGGFQPGACKAPDGMLWFPTAKGMAIIDPINLQTNRHEPPVVIEQLIVDGDPVDLRVHSAGHGASRGLLQIPAGKHRFQIRYTGLSFAVPEKVLFQYRLEPLERQWVFAGAERTVPYSYLPPGQYTFHVTACNNDEVWSREGAALSFVVLPLFWQTWWFETGAIVSGVAMVGGAARWLTRRRVRARLQQLERQQALERERTRIARDIHDDLGASLTRISLLSQTVKGELQDQTQAGEDVDQIYSTARELTRAMDEIVWAVNPKHDSLESLVNYLGRFAQNYLSTAGVRCRLDVPLHLPGWGVTAEIRHNVFLAFKEALHNVVKHAKASEVRVSLELQSDGFVFMVADNGCGFELNGRSEGVGHLKREAVGQTRLGGGNGLTNMQKRMEDVGGRCELDSAAGEGTRVKFVVAVKR